MLAAEELRRSGPTNGLLSSLLGMDDSRHNHQPRKDTMTEATHDKAQPKRHIAVAVRHLVAQRAKALLIKANAQAEIEQLEEALDSLGWTDK